MSNYHKNSKLFNSLGLYKELNTFKVSNPIIYRSAAVSLVIGTAYLSLPTDLYALSAELIKFNMGIEDSTLEKLITGVCTAVGAGFALKIASDKKKLSSKDLNTNIANLTRQMQSEQIRGKDVSDSYTHIVKMKQIDPEIIEKLQNQSMLKNIFNSWKNEAGKYNNGNLMDLSDDISTRQRKNEIAIRAMIEVAKIKGTDNQEFFDKLLGDDQLYLDTVECSDAIIELFNEVSPELDSFSKSILQVLSEDEFLIKQISSELNSSKKLSEKVASDFFENTHLAINAHAEQLMRIHLGQVLTKLVSYTGGEGNLLTAEDVDALQLSMPDLKVLEDHLNSNKIENSDLLRTHSVFKSVNSMVFQLKPGDSLDISDIATAINSVSSYFDPSSLEKLYDCKPDKVGKGEFYRNPESKVIIDDFLKGFYKTKGLLEDNNKKSGSLAFEINSRLISGLVESAGGNLSKLMLNEVNKEYFNSHCPNDVCEEIPDDINENKIGRRVINQKALDAFVDNLQQTDDPKLKGIVRKVNRDMGLIS